MKRIAIPIGAIAGVAAIGYAVRRRRGRSSAVVAAVTINRPPMEVYGFFHDIEQLSRIAGHLFGGRTVRDWAEVHAGELLAWSDGRITFRRAPGRDATEVRIEKQLGFPRMVKQQMVQNDLRHVKQVLETGEVLLSDASVFARPHPAQPPEPGSVTVEPELVVEAAEPRHTAEREVSP